MSVDTLEAPAEAEALDSTSAEDAAPSRPSAGPQTKAETAAETERQPDPPSYNYWFNAPDKVKQEWAYAFAESKLNSPFDESGGHYFLLQAANALVSHTNRYALALVGGKHRVIDLDAKAFETMSLETYRAMTMNRRFPVYNKEGVKTPRELTLGDLWCMFPKRQNFTGGVTFAPPTEDHTSYVIPGVQYNIFQGFNIKPPSRTSYPLFRNHLFEIVCQCDEERFNFVQMWFADILRNPGRKTGSVIILRGEEGVGKSMVGEQFAKIIGERYAIVASTERHVLGNFNSHLSYALFCQVEEALFAGSKGFGALKQLVTGDVMAMEMKGIDVFSLPNFTRFLMCSNERWVVPAGQDARRWFVTDVTSEHKNQPAYFKAIIDEMNRGGREAWAKELMEWPIDEGLLRNPPDTLELGRQRLHSFDQADQFFLDLLIEGDPDLFPQGDGAQPDYPVAREFEDKLFERFEDYLLKRRKSYEANRVRFREAMYKMLCLSHPRQKKVGGINARRFEILPLDALKDRVAECLKLDRDDLG